MRKIEFGINGFLRRAERLQRRPTGGPASAAQLVNEIVGLERWVENARDHSSELF